MMWTGIFAFITILGTWYGAQLKTDWDAVKVGASLHLPVTPGTGRWDHKADCVSQAKKKVLEATPEERIDMLQRQRARLVMAKKPLEDKLERLRTRTREKEMENASPEERKRMVEEQARQDLESGKSKGEKPKAREFKWFGH